MAKDSCGEFVNFMRIRIGNLTLHPCPLITNMGPCFNTDPHAVLFAFWSISGSDSVLLLGCQPRIRKNRNKGVVVFVL